MDIRSRRTRRRSDNADYNVRNVRRRIRYEDEEEEAAAFNTRESETETREVRIVRDTEDVEELSDLQRNGYESNDTSLHISRNEDEANIYVRNETDSSFVRNSSERNADQEQLRRYSIEEFTPLSSRYERSIAEQHEQMISQGRYDESAPSTDLWGFVRNVVDESVNTSNIGTAAILDPLVDYSANMSNMTAVTSGEYSDQDSITREYQIFTPQRDNRSMDRSQYAPNETRVEDAEIIEEEDELFREISLRWYPRTNEIDGMPRSNASNETRSAQRRNRESETNVALLNEIYGENLTVHTAFSSYHPEAVRLWHVTVFGNLCRSFTNDGTGDEQHIEALRRDALILDSTLSVDVARAMVPQALYEAMDNQIRWALSQRFGDSAPSVDVAKFRDVYVAVARMAMLYRYAFHCTRNQSLIEYAVRKLSPKQYATMLRRDRLKDRVPLRFGLFVQLLMERSHVPEQLRQNFRFRYLMPDSLLEDYRLLFRRAAPNRVFAAAARPKHTEHSYRDENGANCAEEPNTSSVFCSVSSTVSRGRSRCNSNMEWLGAWGTLWAAMNEEPYERTNRCRIFDESYCTKSSRVESFSHYHDQLLRSRSEHFSEAGFYCLESKDYVRCFSCGGTLGVWNEYSDPLEEHAKYFPRCDFIYKRLTDQHVYRVWMVSSYDSSLVEQHVSMMHLFVTETSTTQRYRGRTKRNQGFGNGHFVLQRPVLLSERIICGFQRG